MPPRTARRPAPGRLADGVLAYRQHPFHRTLEDPPTVWREGNTRLLDFGATDRTARRKGARAVLVVPSLINRWEVLDLTAVEWKVPGLHEAIERVPPVVKARKAEEAILKLNFLSAAQGQCVQIPPPARRTHC